MKYKLKYHLKRIYWNIFDKDKYNKAIQIEKNFDKMSKNLKERIFHVLIDKTKKNKLEVLTN